MQGTLLGSRNGIRSWATDAQNIWELAGDNLQPQRQSKKLILLRIKNLSRLYDSILLGVLN